MTNVYGARRPNFLANLNASNLIEYYANQWLKSLTKRRF